MDTKTETKSITRDQTGLAETIRQNLCRTDQRELPYSLLYDDLGSALFEAITLLPEYGVTRAEDRLLMRRANEIVNQLPWPLRIAELGSGTGKKTRSILEALEPQGRVPYCAIDVSPYALELCEKGIGDLPFVVFEKIALPYLDGLCLAVSKREPEDAVLALFLGTTIGNFHPPEALSFLKEVRSLLEQGDFLLLGVDLQRDEQTLLSAYDDPIGVTAAFNLNLLGHLNRTFRANFDLKNYAHEARYKTSEHRIEMHLRSKVDQTVTITNLDLQLDLRAGETIWTESSYKYCADDLKELAGQAGFEPCDQWTDAEWPFSANLWRVLPQVSS